MSRMLRAFLPVAAAAAVLSASAARLPKEYSRITTADFDRGYVRGRVSAGESFDFTAPASASCSTNASLRGGATDYVRIRLPWWRFRLGGEEYSELVALGDGTVWLSDEVSIPSVFTPLGIVPSDAWSGLPESCAATCPPLGITAKTRLSVIWHEVTLDSVKVTWQNALLSRDKSRPISYQVELFRNGDFTVRLDLSRVPAGDRVFIYARSEFGVARPTSVRWHRLTAEDMADSDIDGDGIDTERELLDYGTDPRSPDTDGDSASDAQEVAWGSDPSKRDTDGDGFGDATDPHPLKVNAWKNLDAGGFPATWLQRWFGGTSVPPYTDASRNGIPNLASLYMGVSPRVSWAESSSYSGRVLGSGAAAYLAIPSGFSFSCPAGLTNLVDRTFTVYRDSPWQQLFLMSSLDTYAGWDSGDVEIRWEAGVESGTAPSVTWDSFRLPLADTNTFSRIRVTAVTRGDHPRLDRSLFLVTWMPIVRLGTDFNAYWSTAGNNVYMVRTGFDGSYRMPCTVSYGGYPHVGGMSPEVEAALSRPLLPGVSLQESSLVVDGPGSFYMPRLVTQPRYEVVVYPVSWGM